MPWYLWLQFAGSGLASVGCFAMAYAHLRPEARAAGSRLALRGALTRQDIFTPRGWRFRLLGWVFAGIALLALVEAGLRAGPREAPILPPATAPAP